MLLNNAIISHLRGFSIYYAENLKRISANSKNPKPKIELNVKLDIYALQERYNDMIALYQKEK